MKRRLLRLLACCLVCLAAYAAYADEPVASDHPANVTFSKSAAAVDVYDLAEVTVNVARPTAANPFTEDDGA
jgi:hypothetical protein